MISEVQEGQQGFYLDRHKLLVSPSSDTPIHPAYMGWFLNQAILLGYSAHVAPELRERVELLVLHGFSKVSSIGARMIERLGIQSSPLLQETCGYHRCTGNPLLVEVNQALTRRMQLAEGEVHLICSPLMGEIFNREYPQESLDLQIDCIEKYEKLIEDLLKKAKTGVFPVERVVIDFSALLKGGPVDATRIDGIVQTFENVFHQKLEELFQEDDRENKISVAEELIRKLHLVAFTTYQSTHSTHHLALTPRFLTAAHERFSEEINSAVEEYTIKSRHSDFVNELHSMMGRLGYRVAPDQVKVVWLSLKSLDAIIEEHRIPAVALSKGAIPVPPVCSSFSAFIAQPVVSKFKNLSQAVGAPPYLTVFPEATVRLLEGLEKEKVDEALRKAGLEDLLQISYYRMLNAMREAIFKRNDIVAFGNQIEILHQEIQNLLALSSPYGEEAFSASVAARVMNASGGMIPPDGEIPRVHLKPSAMHSFASIVAGVEALKGSNDLCVGILEDSYYNEMHSLNPAKTFEIAVFNEDSNAFVKRQTRLLDLFITELHHNIVHHRGIYRPVKCLEQVKSLFERKLVTDKFTVVIDNTIDVENSDETRAFLADPVIKEKLAQGKLNVVFLRSAQKFDMLGMDNYYGGISIAVNRGESFAKFNERMDHPDGQLRGLNAQGLTHIKKYSGSSVNDFTHALMANAQLLYQKLPANAIYSEGTNNPMQISRIEDERVFFLDIKFPKHPRTREMFCSALVTFAHLEQLSLPVRASFGFLLSSLVLMSGNKMRFSIGLEDETMLNQYADFFNGMQSLIEGVEQENAHLNLSLDEMDAKIAQEIRDHLESN